MAVALPFNPSPQVCKPALLFPWFLVEVVQAGTEHVAPIPLHFPQNPFGGGFRLGNKSKNFLFNATQMTFASDFSGWLAELHDKV